MTLAQQLQWAVQTARAAGQVAMRYYGQVERLTKTHAATTGEAVTLADRACQRLIVERIRAVFPHDGIIGEEDELGQGITFDCKDPAGRNWVIDPIDGTNNFIAGAEHFAVCVGLLEAGEPVLGVVLDVTRDTVYAAARGCGAFRNDRPVTALQTPLSQSSLLMLTSNLIDSKGRCPEWARRWIGQTDWKIRILGSAALEAVQVSAGVAHAAITVNGKLWDCVAPAAIVLEAGGSLTDLAGRAIFPFDLRNYSGAKVPFLAAGPAARQEILDFIRANP